MFRISLSDDGTILAVGQPYYDNNLGLVETFLWENGDWVKLGRDILGESAGSQLGYTVGLTGDASMLAVGAHGADKVLFYDLVEFFPSSVPSMNPSISAAPTVLPTLLPSSSPTMQPSSTLRPSLNPTKLPSFSPSFLPSVIPTVLPSSFPSSLPTFNPSLLPTSIPNVLYVKNDARTLVGGPGLSFGFNFALTSDGSRIIVGAEYANANDGAFFSYEDSGTTWQFYDPTMGQVGPPGTRVGFGKYVDISADGNKVATGTVYFDSGGLSNNGYANVWSYSGSGWSQLGSSIFGDSSNAKIGYHVKISDDATRFITGSKSYLGSNGAAQVFLFNSDSNDWDQLGTDIRGDQANDGFGNVFAMSGDGSTVAITSDGGRRYIWVMYYNVDQSDWVLKGAQLDLPGTAYKSESLWLNNGGSQFAYSTYNTGVDGFVRV